MGEPERTLEVSILQQSVHSVDFDSPVWTSVFAGSQFRQTSDLFCIWIWVPWLQSAAMPSRMPGTQVKNIHLDKATLRVDTG